MRFYKIDQYFEAHFSTQRFDTGAATDADALPTYRVYEENNDTVIDSGNTSKVDDSNTTGYYKARAQCTTALGYEVGKVYHVRVAATVNSVAGSAVIGKFTIVPAVVWDSLYGGTDTLEVDAVAVSGDTTAADALESQFDGTGLTGGTYPSTQAQVSAIGSGTGAALNFAADSDNASVAIKSVSKVGTETGTYTNTANDNGIYHVITNATNNIDWVYGFTIGAGRAASKAVFVGYLAASAPATSKTITIFAYNFTGTPGWDTVKVITGQAGTTDVTVDIALLAAHTGTGADAGKVYIRFTATSQAGAVLNTDQLYVQAQNLGQTVGYANGAIWVKATGTSGTTPYVNGTADNPCPWADAKTLNSTLALNRYTIVPGTTVTLDAALAGAVMTGRSYGLALGGQNISGSYFEGVEGLSGTGTCATGEAVIVDCHLNAVTIGEADFVRCHLMGTITMSQASVPYRFHDCTGISSAKIAFNAANQSAVISRMSGVLTIAGMVSTNTLYIDGDGDVTLDATNTAGTVYIAGNIRLTNLGSGQTITDTSRWGEDQNVAAVTGAVASVTGAVGSVTGAVGSVTGAVGSVTGDVGGKVLGGGAGTITGTGVRAIDGSGNAIAPASATTAISNTLGSAGAGLTALGDTRIANLDAAVSTRSTLTAQQVWEYTTRTLSSFGTLVADVATAVWGAATRTLSAFGFSVTASTVSDKTGYSLATAPPTAAEIKTAVEVDGGKIDSIYDKLPAGTIGDATASSQTTIAGYIDTEVAAILAAVDTEVAAIKAKTDLIPASPAATGDIPTADQNAVAVLAHALAAESYASDGSVPTLSQILYMLWSAIGDFSISGTTITCKKLDGSTTAMTFTLDDGTSPTRRTRAT